MYEFLKLQYQMGKIDAEMLQSYVPHWITQDEYNQIVGDVSGE